MKSLKTYFPFILIFGLIVNSILILSDVSVAKIYSEPNYHPARELIYTSIDGNVQYFDPVKSPDNRIVIMIDGPQATNIDGTTSKKYGLILKFLTRKQNGLWKIYSEIDEITSIHGELIGLAGPVRVHFKEVILIQLNSTYSNVKFMTSVYKIPCWFALFQDGQLKTP